MSDSASYFTRSYLTACALKQDCSPSARSEAVVSIITVFRKKMSQLPRVVKCTV